MMNSPFVSYVWMIMLLGNHTINLFHALKNCIVHIKFLKYHMNFYTFFNLSYEHKFLSSLSYKFFKIINLSPYLNFVKFFI